MSVTSCKLEFQSQDYNVDEKYKQEATLTWYITTNNKLDGPITLDAQVYTAKPDPVPRVYGAYQIGNDYSNFLLARNVGFKRIANSNTDWRATVKFTNTLDPGQAEQNPLNRLPIDTWDNEQFQRALEKDIDGKPIVTPAGQPFDPPLTVDDTRPILTYVRNEASYPQSILTYQDAINADLFLIFPPRTAKINISAAKRFEKDVKYYETKYVVHFRHDGWKREGLNRGTWFKATAATTLAKVTKLLPGAAKVLLASDGTLTDADNPSYSTFKVYRELPFAPLNIYIP